MATLLSNNPGSRLPEDGSLDRLVARLASVSSAVGVIRLVERWATVRTPTRFALVAEARAFIELRLMDRAWVRLRELTEADPNDTEVLALTAEMFIGRGWPARAARLVEPLQALGLDADRLRAIEEGVRAPPLRPPSDAREVERSGSVQEQVTLAETFLATGSVLRARGLLERLGRSHETRPRIQQLLWGLRGEFTAGQQDLSALVTELQTGLSSDGGWEASEPTASLEQADPETAEASKVLPVSPAQQGDRGAAFQSLFRFGGDETAPSNDLEDDVTVAAVMASQEELADPPTYEHSDPEGLIESSAGDTQIMQVIGSGEHRRLAPVSGEVHTPGQATDRGPVDLRAWRAEHGVVPSTSLLDSPTRDIPADFDEEGFLEEEDEDVVVMTHQEEPAHDPRTPVVRRAPISVIERVPEPPPPIPDLPGQDEDTPTIGPAPGRADQALVAGAGAPDSGGVGELPADPDPSIDLEPMLYEEPPAAPVQRTSWVALGAVALAIVGLFSAVLGVVLTRHWVASTQSAAVRDAVLDSHPATLLPLRRELQELYRDGGILAPGQAHVATSLILVDLALWEVVSGDPAVLNEALTLAEAGMGGPDRNLAVAWIDRALGVPVSPAALGDDPLSALLLAEAAIDAGDWEAAAMALDGVSLDAGIRLMMADVRIRARKDAVAVATLPEKARMHPLGEIWMYEGGDASLSDQERIGLLRTLGASLPEQAAKLRARALVAEARVHGRSGRVEAAATSWREALKANPHDPGIISHVAATSRRPSHSMALLQDCLKMVQSSPPCQRGLVQMLIETGAVAEARQYVDLWREAGLGVGLLSDWVLLEGGDLSHRPGPPEPSDPDRAGYGLTRYLDAIAQEREAARRSGLDKAVSNLRDSTHPWDRRLADHIDTHKEQMVQRVSVKPGEDG